MPATPVLYVLNGPNLNLLGTREPEIYGHDTLADIQALCERAAPGWSIVFRQTNHEGVLIDWIHEARTEAQALVVNPAAWTHTSIALLDALKTLSIPIIECHLSDPQAREPFRHHSYVALAAAKTISGHGAHSYELAVQAALELAPERAVA
jgi:3-dehydroquinate dehydratase-2